jgi:type 2 lantibiotic biosynthesis protein LanM
MDITIFNRFFEFQLKKLVGEKLFNLQENIDNNLYDKVYARFAMVLGRSLIRVLLPEYNLFSEKEENKNKNKEEILHLFSEFVNSDDFDKIITDKYPQVNEIILNSLSSSVDYLKEVYDNYEKDRTNIEQNLGCEYGKLIDIILWQGDVHNGKSACKLVTENGCIYYKPVGGANVTLFYEIINLLLKDKKDINIIKSKIYSTDSHMWMEEIKHKTCNTLSEVNNYYFVSGVYLFAFYVLNTYDMHHENIISNGSTPVIVDFETLSLLSTNNFNSNFRDISNSVLNTMYIPFIADRGVFDINISGILSHSEVSVKNEYYDYNISLEEGLKVDKKNSSMQISNQISLNGEQDINKFISLEEIRRILRDGFLYSSNVVLNNKKLFVTLIKDFISHNYVEFRQLLRPTEVYHQFVEACKHPESLMSSKKTNEILMMLFNNFKPTGFGYLRVEEEVNDIKKGYIPRFYTLGYSRDLFSNGNIICKDYFPVSIIDMIEQKINSINLDQIKYQMNLIDYSLLTKVKKEYFGKSYIFNNVDKDRLIDSQYVKNVVYELIERFRFMEIKYEGDISTILAPHLSEKGSMWKVREISSSLYEYGGLVILCAQYGYLYEDSEIIDFALRILDYFNITSMINIKNPNLSVFAGEGSLIYINYRIYQILCKVSGYEKKAKQYMEKYIEYRDTALEIVLMKEINITDFDYIQGIQTSVYLISKIYLKEKDNEILKKLEEIKELVVNRLDITEASDIGFAHGITGIALILSSLYKIFLDEKILIIIRNLLLKENELIDKEGINTLHHTWCRGTTGIMLGRNMIYDNLFGTCSSVDANTQKIILKYNEVLFQEKLIESMLEIDNLSMCHGVYGNIEVFSRLKLSDKYKFIMEKIYFRSFSNINWISNQLEVPIDTFMLGNSGIAYALLELISKEVPAIMPLDI